MEEQARHIVPPQNQSEDIGKLAEALAKAQAEMSAAKKDAKNPFFKSDYATLASCIEAGNTALNKNGLSVTQLPGSDNGFVSVDTRLLHSSGQWIKSSISVKPQKTDPQALGSCLTYLRRYSYSAIIGQATADDDDGESAMSRVPKKPIQKSAKKPIQKPIQKSKPKEEAKPDNMEKFVKTITDLVDGEEMTPAQFDAFMEGKKVEKLTDLKDYAEQLGFYDDLREELKVA